MRPQPAIARRIDEAGNALARALGARAACIAVYGSAAGEEFSPAHSDVNLLVVLSEISFNDLRLIGTTLERLASRDLQFATPLVVQPRFLRDARDTFPIELEDIRERHRVIAGEDLLAYPRLAPASLRLTAEREARAAVLRLRALAIHRPPDEALRAGIAHLVASLAVIGSALVAVGPGGVRPQGAALLAEIARRSGVGLGALGAVLEMRDGRRPWPADRELDLLLERLLDDLDALVAAIDERRF